MKQRWHELTRENALCDPLVQSMMAADRVDPRELDAMLCRIAHSMQQNALRLVEQVPPACVSKRAPVAASRSARGGRRR